MQTEASTRGSVAAGKIRPAALHWQSRFVLLLIFAPAGIYAVLALLHMAALPSLIATAISFGFAALVYLARAAPLGAALFGALLTFCFVVTPSYPHSALWVLLTTLVLTLGASRVGRSHKQATAPEEKRGRSAAQVAANIGIASLCGTLIASHGSVLAHAAMAAALAETAADTLASELGCLAPGAPRMLLGGRQVPAGTDGAISVVGTCAGIAGAACVSAVAAWAFALPHAVAFIACAVAVACLFLDSLLGQLVERRGLLNNDAVNFLSNAAAAALSLIALRL